MNGCRNQLKVGEVTTFAAFIKNSGDTAIEEMGYSVTVYLDDGNGNTGMIARDLQGNDLSWENGNVVCDDVLACPYSTLAAGAILGGGKTTLQYGGADIQWTPIAGDYIVEVVANALDDADPGNDIQQITVSVINWVDIAVDLSWDNNNGNDVMTGSGQKDFTLTVTSNGSADMGFNPREVAIQLKVAGNLLQATSGSDDIYGTTILTAGISGQTVDTFTNVSTDPPTVTTGTGTVLNY
jgi:archaellum component FlaG (FlaF/FlaG flagellin family)